MARTTVKIEDIVGVGEILTLAGITNRRVLIAWRARKPHPFPKPIRQLAAGEVWDRRAVAAWLRDHR